MGRREVGIESWHQKSRFNPTPLLLYLLVEVDDVGETSEDKSSCSVQPQAALSPLSDLPTVNRQTEGKVSNLLSYVLYNKRRDNICIGKK